MGCCYATVCCDCGNACDYSSNTWNQTGSSSLEKLMEYKIKDKCDGQELCSFPSHPKKYANHSALSGAYLLKIGYYCVDINNQRGYLRTFNDRFDSDSNYEPVISCTNNISTTNRTDSNPFSLSKNFSNIGFSAITCGILGFASSLLPDITSWGGN